jgi:two-component system OmpR family response regulator
VRTAADGAHAVTAARQFRPDVVLLDVMLPDLDGLTVLRRIRADDHDVPVVFLTARDAVDDRVAGLTVGGDDYVTKPFSLEEVVARLRALLRRSGATAVRSSGEPSGCRRPTPTRAPRSARSAPRSTGCSGTSPTR